MRLRKLFNNENFPIYGIDPERISLAKFGPVANLGGLLTFLETTQMRIGSTTHNVL